MGKVGNVRLPFQEMYAPGVRAWAKPYQGCRTSVVFLSTVGTQSRLLRLGA